jgi:hypothetical protein
MLVGQVSSLCVVCVDLLYLRHNSHNVTFSPTKHYYLSSKVPF